MRLYWKGVFLFLTIASGMVSCVSPFYGTARIEEGLSGDVGFAWTSYMVDTGPYRGVYSGPSPGEPHYYGVRGDVEFRYGLSKHIQLNARTGTGWGSNGKIYMDTFFDVDDHFLLDIALGSQFAYPLTLKNGWKMTPAIRLEACYGYGKFYAYPTLLLGLGDPEFLTIGGRYYVPMDWLSFFPTDFFATIHIYRFSLFAGINVYTQIDPDYWKVPTVATLGIGYKLK